MMLPSLVFISPHWCSELEELIQITKNSFQIKILTQKQNFDLDDPYLEVLQCLDTYSPIELTKLIPWMIQHQAPQFHVILPSHASPRQLAGIGTLITLAKAIPHSHLTHSPWPPQKWPFKLWLKAFQNLFDGDLQNYCSRLLSLPKTSNRKNLTSQTHMDEEDATSLQSSNELNTDFNLRREIKPYSSLWIFPTQNILDSEWQTLVYVLLRKNDNFIELWNWNTLPPREKNKIRNKFYLEWKQFHPRHPRFEIEEWNNVKFLVFTSDKSFPLSEIDLLDLVIIHKINIIMDETNRRGLKGPWLDGDSFWLWHPSLLDNENRPWNSSFITLPFSTLSSLENFRDQLSNQVLRSLFRQQASQE